MVQLTLLMDPLGHVIEMEAQLPEQLGRPGRGLKAVGGYCAFRISKRGSASVSSLRGVWKRAGLHFL